MSNIKFDQIHTKEKQAKLKQMMQRAAKETLQIANTNARLTTCPVCQSPNIADYVTKFGYPMDSCSDCHQIFCNPMPSQEQLDCYYNGPMKAFENKFFSESFEHRVAIFDYRIELINKYHSSGRLLDIGSAIGIFVEALHRADTQLSISCCEPSKDACTRLKSRFADIQLFECWLQQMPDTEKFDVITLWDTIEHIVELDVMCKKIRQLIAKQGVWVFSTPNTHSFEWQTMGKEHVQLLPPGHLNLFNTKNIGILMARHGFNILEIQTPNGSLDVSYIQKKLKSDKALVSSVGNFLYDALNDEAFASQFSTLLKTTGNAGNMVVVAQPVSENA